MQELLPKAERIAAILTARHQTIAIVEGSSGGLVGAALLAVPGASAYFLGGAIVYTRSARELLLELTAETVTRTRPATEAYAQLLARTMQQRLKSVWALAESGAAGPTPNRYGDAAGRTCLAVVGPVVRSVTLETGRADRPANMQSFAAAALDLLERCVAAA